MILSEPQMWTKKAFVPVGPSGSKKQMGSIDGAIHLDREVIHPAWEAW